MTPLLKRIRRLSVGVAAAALGLGMAFSAQADVKKVEMVVFGPPSLGAFLPPVIEKFELDIKNGVDLVFVQRPPSAYNAQFNSGEFKLGGSAALLSVANASNKGIKVSYLFNVFDYFGAVVTRNPEVKTLKDLEGKTLAAATATTNYAMFRWLAGRQGVKTDAIEVVNTAPPGLVGFLLANRADAVQLWEPAFSVVSAQAPELRVLDLNAEEQWKSFSSTTRIPYLGVAAHEDWIAENKALIPGIEQAYKDAAAWILANPKEASELIAATIKNGDPKVIEALISQNARLALGVDPASGLEAEIKAVFAAGLELGYLDKEPAASTIYKGD